MPAVPVPDTPETDPETQIATRPDPDDALNDGKELNEEDLDGKELNEGDLDGKELNEEDLDGKELNEGDLDGKELNEEDLDGGGGRMSFLDHLDELRKRLVTSVGAIFVGVLVAFPFYERITAFVMVPLNATLEDGQGFIYTEPTEAFFLLIKVSALVGLLLALPIVLTQFWLFVAPGLYAHEKKFAIPFVTLSTLFFMGGCMFSHYLLFPVAWAFLGGFSTDYLTFLPRLQPTFSLYIRLTLACGVVFQMPTVVLFLARVGVLTARFLLRNTKYAILVIFIVAAVMTPTGDPATLTLMAAPMIVLYGVSIVIAWVVAPRKPATDE